MHADQHGDQDADGKQQVGAGSAECPHQQISLESEHARILPPAASGVWRLCAMLAQRESRRRKIIGSNQERGRVTAARRGDAILYASAPCR